MAPKSAAAKAGAKKATEEEERGDEGAAEPADGRELVRRVRRGPPEVLRSELQLSSSAAAAAQRRSSPSLQPCRCLSSFVIACSLSLARRRAEARRESLLAEASEARACFFLFC